MQMGARESLLEMDILNFIYFYIERERETNEQIYWWRTTNLQVNKITSGVPK